MVTSPEQRSTAAVQPAAADGASGASAEPIPLIRVRDLRKEFRRPKRHHGFLGGLRTLVTRQYTVTQAVAGVSFDIAEGELVGYLGPNGAGKSTTIKMLTGILVPTSGTVEVAGVTPWRERERNARQIGVVFGQRSQLWWDLPLIDSFKLIGKLYDIPRETYHANLERFTELLGMADFLDTPVRQLSLGQRMRGDLAAAMLYNPRILYLDEPTIGLDVVAKERMRSFVAELNRQDRTTVILTTHDLDDVERLCSRIVLIDRGRVLYDGDVAALKARYAPYRELVVQVADQGSVQETATAHELSALVPGVDQVRFDGSKVRLRFNPERVQVADVVAAVLERHRVLDLAIVEPNLEDVIHQIYDERPTAA
ncbi:ABC-2 type transport system ATP-binding protein [Thermasporomyces composti]|uniref:ABC-2 type transport system ATP-binding protein n=1 Tax=Thermasporomyces composti TaxID=696763 RepID=A0A3D9V845_THECX|nr:ABC-2 type transport system ATP-binding protein [Thermasporomyces composti]